jgi:phosphomannomutase
VTAEPFPFDLMAAILDWRTQDPDEETRDEITKLLADADKGSRNAVADLTDRFATRLEFGTAGLRGALGAGPNRMNRVLVAQTAAGLAAFLLAREEHPSAVIGYDGRTNSRVFATDTAEILAGAGVRAILLPRLLPTPVLAFAVRHLDVSAGVMVTASHNPAADNGYKVYLGGADAGSQIVPPSDGEIAAQIERVAAGDIRDLPRSAAYETAGEDVLDAYVRGTAALANPAAESAPVAEPVEADLSKNEPLRQAQGPQGAQRPTANVVYTAMHGVGWETARRVFVAAGFGEPTVVAEQIEPDAAFPTVAFPNPEEPGAMDLAFATATRVGADLVIANDPDADRLAIGVPTETGWRRLSGNEVGWLLGWRAAERVARASTGSSSSTGSTGSSTGTARTLACSIVSSPALQAVADSYGLKHVETLTGFKWISRAEDLAFGYEEALGYLVDPQLIRDKDGISAAVDLLALVSELAAQGKTLADHAEDFAARFGAFASSQISLRVSDLADIPRIMSELRANPPTSIGGVKTKEIDDFIDGFGGPEGFGPNDILRIWMEDGSRIVVRPSGTEPKLKAYIDASSTEGGPRERLAAAEAKVVVLDGGMRALLG